MINLAVILPHSEEHIENFTEHFRATVQEGDDLYYKLCFIKQKSNRPLNKGKLFNIGYLLHKDRFDYFCFHDVNLLPLTDDSDYSYPKKPTHLASIVDDEYIPYEEFIGGVFLINKEHFEQINGYLLI